MIPVVLAPEPPEFDSLVRQPGLDALLELTGRKPKRTRPGPRRKKIAARIEDIPPDKIPPFWRDASELLLAAYRRVCAYACLRIPHVTGSETADHSAPKSRAVAEAYEWSNYRLACGLMNTRKGAFPDVLDPFEVGAGWFALDLVSLAAVPGPQVPPAQLRAVRDTITRLGLDGPEYKAALEDRYDEYRRGDLTLANLEKWAPFLASELRRQGRLLRGDH